MASNPGVVTASKRTIHPVDQVLPPVRLGVYGLQHVLAFYAGAVIVPLLLSAAIGLTQEQTVALISADLFTCGIASIIQSVGFWNVGVRLPQIQGVTFTAVAPMIAIGKAASTPVAGLLEIYGAVIIAGIFTFLIAPYYSRLLHLFPPVVTGTVITIIGVTLVPVAILSAGGGNPAAPDFASPKNLAFAAGTLLLILCIYRFFRGFLSTIAVLLGLVIGTAVATAFGLVDVSEVGKAAFLGGHHAIPLWATDVQPGTDHRHDCCHTNHGGGDNGRRLRYRRDRGEDNPGGGHCAGTAGTAGGWALNFARWYPELLPLHLLCRKYRARTTDPRQEPFRRGRRGRDHDSTRALPQGSRACRCHPSARAWRRCTRSLRHGRRGRYT